jgi:hypothetical protein
VFDILLIFQNPHNQITCLNRRIRQIVNIQKRHPFCAPVQQGLRSNRGIVEKAVPPLISEAAWCPGGRQAKKR